MLVLQYCIILLNLEMANICKQKQEFLYFCFFILHTSDFKALLMAMNSITFCKYVEVQIHE